jgi:hypothetical protein
MKCYIQLQKEEICYCACLTGGLWNILPSRLTLCVLHMKLLVIISVDFHILHLQSFVEDLLFCWLSNRYLCESIKQVSTVTVPRAWSANRRRCSDYSFWASCSFCCMSKTNWWHRKPHVHITFCGLINTDSCLVLRGLEF